MTHHSQNTDTDLLEKLIGTEIIERVRENFILKEGKDARYLNYTLWYIEKINFLLSSPYFETGQLERDPWRLSTEALMACLDASNVVILQRIFLNFNAVIYFRWLMREILRRQEFTGAMKLVQGEHRNALVGALALQLEQFPQAKVLHTELVRLFARNDIQQWLQKDYPELYEELKKLPEINGQDLPTLSELPWENRGFWRMEINNMIKVGAFARLDTDLILAHKLSKFSLMRDHTLDTCVGDSVQEQFDQAYFLRYFRYAISDDDIELFLDSRQYPELLLESKQMDGMGWAVCELLDRGRADLIRRFLVLRDLRVIISVVLQWERLWLPASVADDLEACFRDGSLSPCMNDWVRLSLLKYANSVTEKDQTQTLRLLELLHPVEARQWGWETSNPEASQALVDRYYETSSGRIPVSEDYAGILARTQNDAERCYAFEKLWAMEAPATLEFFPAIMRSVRSLYKVLTVLIPYARQHKEDCTPTIQTLLADTDEGRQTRIIAGILAMTLELPINRELLPPLFRQLDLPEAVRKELMPIHWLAGMEDPLTSLQMDLDWYLEGLWCKSFGRTDGDLFTPSMEKELQKLGVPVPHENCFSTNVKCFFYPEHEVDAATLAIVDEAATQFGFVRLPWAAQNMILRGYYMYWHTIHIHPTLFACLRCPH